MDISAITVKLHFIILNICKKDGDHKRITVCHKENLSVQVGLFQKWKIKTNEQAFPTFQSPKTFGVFTDN